MRGAVLHGAGRLIAVGSNDRPITFEVAKKYGATDLVDYHAGDLADQILKLTDGKGVDKVLIAGGMLPTPLIKRCGSSSPVARSGTLTT